MNLLENHAILHEAELQLKFSTVQAWAYYVDKPEEK